LNDANGILFKRNEIALEKHSNNSHQRHICTLSLYIYSKTSLTDTNWFLLISYFWQRKNIPKKSGKHHRD